MQYHYVVFYDTDKREWFVETDTTAYFSDGNVWSDAQYEQMDVGWMVPEYGSEEEDLDQRLWQILNDIKVAIPVPQDTDNE